MGTRCPDRAEEIAEKVRKTDSPRPEGREEWQQ